MYTHNRHFTLLIIAALTFGVTIVGYAYMRGRVYSQAIATSNLLRQVQEMEEKKKREIDVKSTYMKLVEQQKKVHSYVLTKETAVEFIEQVEKVGTDTSTALALEGIASQDDKTNNAQGKFNYLTAHVEGKGSWGNIMRALSLIENMPYSLVLDNVRIVQDIATDIPGDSSKESSKAASGRTWILSFDVKVLSLKSYENI